MTATNVLPSSFPVPTRDDGGYWTSRSCHLPCLGVGVRRTVGVSWSFFTVLVPSLVSVRRCTVLVSRSVPSCPPRAPLRSCSWSLCPLLLSRSLLNPLPRPGCRPTSVPSHKIFTQSPSVSRVSHHVPLLTRSFLNPLPRPGCRATSPFSQHLFSTPSHAPGVAPRPPMTWSQLLEDPTCSPTSSHTRPGHTGSSVTAGTPRTSGTP